MRLCGQYQSHDPQARARRERYRRQASPPASPAHTNQVAGSGICWGSNGGTYVQTNPASPATTSCPEPAYISIQKPWVGLMPDLLRLYTENSSCGCAAEGLKARAPLTPVNAEPKL